LFDFFQDKKVNRQPATFEALVDRDERVGWASVEQAFAGDLSHLSGVANATTRTLSVTGVKNTDVIRMHADGAGLTGTANVHALAQADGAFGYTISVCDSVAAPAWLETPGTGTLIPGTQSDPDNSGLLAPVSPFANTAVDAHLEPDYVAQLKTSPEPATVGGTVNFTLQGHHDANFAWLLMGLVE